MLDNVVRDVRHGLRMLARNPGFSLAAILSIGIGVGANVAMYGVADAVFLRPLPQDGVLAEVVGIATDAKYTWIGEAPRGFVYLARAQSSIADNTLLVRTDAEAAALAEPLREVVRAIDPDMPPFGIRTMENFYHSRAVHTTNLMLGNVAGMGAIGLLLAVVGLYGVISHAATRRTKEFGIRLATGATPKMLLTSVLRQGAFIVSWGVVTGLIASIAVERLLVSAFPGIVEADATTLVLVVITVVT